MNPIDPRSPVIVGAAQSIVRPDPAVAPTDRPGPIELMAEALGDAATDAGSIDLAGTDLVAVVNGVWSIDDPGRLIADAMGALSARTLLTDFGGQTPMALLASLAERIQTGELNQVVIVGGEAGHTRRALRKLGAPLDPISQPDGTKPDELYGSGLDMVNEYEKAYGLIAPPVTYALMASAIAADRNESLSEYQARAATVWLRFSEAAQANPYAWDRAAHTADSIATPSPDNRMVSLPFTKAMCANNLVDMGSALILMSTRRASELGVSSDRWVFPHSATVAHDSLLLSERESFAASSAMADAGPAAMSLAGITIDDINRFELYACFPSIVDQSRAALGLAEDDPRPLTSTGGLGFAGAPLNNSAGQGLAAMVQQLRAEPGTIGLVHGNGGFATKHAFGVFSTNPASRPFQFVNRQHNFDLVPTPVAGPYFAGTVHIEAFTVAFDHDGPTQLVVAGRNDDGARAWGSSTEAATIADALAVDTLVGRRAHIPATTEPLGSTQLL